MEDNFIIFIDGDNSVKETITSYSGYSNLNENQGLIQMGVIAEDQQGDSISDLIRVNMKINVDPSQVTSLGIILPLEYFIESQMRFKLIDYIPIKIEGLSSKTTVVGDLAFIQEEIVNQK